MSPKVGKFRYNVIKKSASGNRIVKTINLVIGHHREQELLDIAKSYGGDFLEVVGMMFFEEEVEGIGIKLKRNGHEKEIEIEASDEEENEGRPEAA